MPLRCVLLLLLCAVAFAGNIPMSNCRFARATIASTPSPPQGTCGFGTVSQYMPTWWAGKYVTSPDDETYNGYPFDTSTPLSITTGGVGLACGECFELTGNNGNSVVVMAADVCDKGCCTNCQGSLGGPGGKPDVQAFDIDPSIMAMIATSSYGSLGVKFRKVSCDMSAAVSGPVTLHRYIDTTQAHNGWWFRFKFFGMIYGIALVEVRGPVSGGTGGQWSPMRRAWQQLFDVRTME